MPYVAPLQSAIPSPHRRLICCNAALGLGGWSGIGLVANLLPPTSCSDTSGSAQAITPSTYSVPGVANTREADQSGEAS